jgi:hypothetical protein
LGSGPKGRRFESCRARHNNLRESQGQTVLVGRGGETDAHESRACHDDSLADRVHDVRPLGWQVRVLDGLTDRPQPSDGTIG